MTERMAPTNTRRNDAVMQSLDKYSTNMRMPAIRESNEASDDVSLSFNDQRESTDNPPTTRDGPKEEQKSTGGGGGGLDALFAATAANQTRKQNGFR